MQNMFQLCKELISLDLSNYNTSNVTNMSNIFDDCEKLEYLNIINFVIKNNCETKNIFNNLKKECKFYSNNKILNNLYSLSQ